MAGRSAKHDGTGPYLRVEITVGVAIVKRDNKLLNRDFVDATLIFGRAIAGGEQVTEEYVTSERSQQIIGELASGICNGIRGTFDGGTLSYMGTLGEKDQPMTLMRGTVTGTKSFPGLALRIPRERNPAEAVQ
jgi:hypothetical protein